MSAGEIRIVREERITTTPEPGRSLPVVAITYQLPLRPPQVILIRVEDLPDWQWREANPGQEPPPPDLVAQADTVRRRRIAERIAGGGESPARTI